jgi:hypothetical protein
MFIQTFILNCPFLKLSNGVIRRQRMELNESIVAVLRSEEHEKYSKSDFSNKPLNNIKTLLNIYRKEKGKENIITTILLNSPNPNHSYLGFEFLLRVREIKKAFEYLEKNLNKIRNQNLPYFRDYYYLFNKCLLRLNFVIDDEKFNAKEIGNLRNNVIELGRLLPKKHQKLGNDYYSSPEISVNNDLRSDIIKKIDQKKAGLICEDYNSDLLKEDLNFVIEKIKEMELGDTIALAFAKLEERYYEAKDNSDFAMFGGYIRQTLMALVKAIALKAAVGKEEIIKERDEHYRNYLKKEGIINEGMWRMLSAFYDFLSIELNHNIETDQEYYRRGLNIASQISYLLLRDYEKFIESKK